MEIVINKGNGIKFSVSIEGMPSIYEMRNALYTALQQEGYTEEFLEDVFNLQKVNDCQLEPTDDYFTEKLESALEEVGKTTEIEDKANQIQAIVENTEENVRVLWVVRDRHEIDEAVKALDRECFKGFVAMAEYDTIAIRKKLDITSPRNERSVSVIISTRFINGRLFTHII